MQKLQNLLILSLFFAITLNLQSCKIAFNDYDIDRFMQQAKRYMIIREALDPNSDILTPFECNWWLEKHRENEGLHQRPKYPAIWDITEVDHIVEMPMHLGHPQIVSIVLFIEEQERRICEEMQRYPPTIEDSKGRHPAHPYLQR